MVQPQRSQAGVGSGVATIEIGAIEERGMEEGDCKVLGPQPHLPHQHTRTLYPS